MADSSSWNKDLPDGNTYVRQADDIARSNQSALQATLLEEHYFGSSETTKAGVHKPGSARAYVAASSALPAPALEPQGRLVLTSDSKALYGFLSTSTTPTKIFDPADYYTRSASDASFQPKGSYSTVGHIHDDRYYTEAESNALFQPKGSYAPAVHTHDDRYYTESESDARFAAVGHLHTGVYHPYGGSTGIDFSAKSLTLASGVVAQLLTGSAVFSARTLAVGESDSISVAIAGAKAGDVVLVQQSENSNVITAGRIYADGTVNVYRYCVINAGAPLDAETLKVYVVKV